MLAQIKARLILASIAKNMAIVKERNNKKLVRSIVTRKI